MRILFFSHYFPPEGNAPAARCHAHCRRWAASGHEVTVITCAPNHPRGVVYPGYRNRPWHVDQMDGVRVVRVLTWLAPNSGLWKRVANWLSYLAAATLSGVLQHRPDVVVATSPQPLCAWAGVLASRSHRCPLVLEIRDLWPESVAAVGALRSRAALKLVGAIAHGPCRAAAHIVTVGEGYRQGLVARGLDRARIDIVMNGVDRELFHPRAADPAFAARLGVAGRFVVAYCGTIGLAHGLDVVLRAGAVLRARRRRDIVFLLAGDGARLDALRAAAAAAKLNNVVFTGGLPRRHVPAILACSDVCLVHLRASEAFASVMPSKIFEGAAMGLPVVLGVRGFAQRFVEAAGCGVCIAPEDADALVDSVLRLADDPGLRRRFGQAGRKCAARFDRELLAARYLEIIEQVAGQERQEGVASGGNGEGSG